MLGVLESKLDFGNYLNHISLQDHIEEYFS